MKQQIYAEIQSDIISKIDNGTYKPDEKIPTEKELCSMYSTSRSTVVKALKNLVNQGHLTSIERVGYFVAKPVTNRFYFTYDFPSAHGDTRITSEERPVPRKMTVLSENGKGRYNAIQFCFISKCSRTVIKYRKMYVLYNKGVFININKTDKAYWNKTLDQLMRVTKSTKMQMQYVIPTGNLALELETKTPTLYIQIKRWDYDEYGKAMAYYETYIKADSFSINAKSKI